MDSLSETGQYANQFLKEYEENVVQARNSLNHVENLLESIVEVKKENPWLTHVKKTMAENPTKKFKDVLKIAKKTYVKK